MTAYEIVQVPSCLVLFADGHCRHEELGPKIGELFASIMTANPDAELADPPRIYYLDWRPEDCDIEAAVPVDAVPAGAASKVMPACKALRAVHQGPYEGLPQAWTDLWTYARENGLTSSGFPWDSYVTDPGEEPDSSQWITEIYIPLE